MTFFSRLFVPIRWLLSRWKRCVVFGVVGFIGVPLLCDVSISRASVGKMTSDVNAAEPRTVALVLGTSRNFNGRKNGFYTTRIDAAVELFRAGKVRGILVSGDNGTRYYDEPTAMKEDLIAAGVPEEFITLDYAGFRTRDSVIRAKEVFGQTDLMIVSQKFHAERALFIAQQEGIRASAFIAADPASKASNAKVRVREVMARTLAVVDSLLDRQPKFLGEREAVALRAD